MFRQYEPLRIHKNYQSLLPITDVPEKRLQAGDSGSIQRWPHKAGILREIICDCVKLTDSGHFHGYEIDDIEPVLANDLPACFKQSPRHQKTKTLRKRHK